MKPKSIGFIGGGRITKIVLQSFLNKNVEFPSIKVFDINTDSLAELKRLFPAIETAEAIDKIAGQEIIFIALHPPVIGETVASLKDHINGDAVIISLAPKITIEKLSALTGSEHIVRMIPNATSYINKGYNPVCFSAGFNESEKISILDLLKILGITFETEENKLEAYAIVSAMLPTYFWFQWKEMEEIATEIGLSKTEGREAIFETLNAALDLIYNSGMYYEEVTDLIPVKPIAQNESDIKQILQSNLISLHNKIKP